MITSIDAARSTADAIVHLTRYSATSSAHILGEIVFSTPFAHLHDFSQGCTDDVVPTLVLPPQAGHSSTVVDFSPAQSQLAVIRAAGLTRAYVLDWRPAIAATRHVTITDYLDVIDRSIDLLGGRANLVGDCQGGWLAGRDHTSSATASSRTDSNTPRTSRARSTSGSSSTCSRTTN